MTPSSSRIVTIPVGSLIVAPVGFDSTTLNCSVGSAVLLLTTLTWNVRCVAPGVNVSVALAVW